MGVASLDFIFYISFNLHTSSVTFKNVLTSLNLSSSISKWCIIIAPVIGIVVWIKCDTAYKVLYEAFSLIYKLQNN